VEFCVSTYMVRASALSGYRETVRALGGEPEALLARHGMADAPVNLEHWISYADWLRLLDDSARELDCPCFGLELSERQDINILGAVGFMMRQAPDVRTALAELSAYFNHHNQGATVAASVEDGKVLWNFTPRPNLQAPLVQQTDLVVGIATGIMRLLSPRWQPSTIYLPHRAPEDLRPYEQRFQCPVFFDWDTTMVVSEAGVLDNPLSEADDALHRILEAHLRDVQQLNPDSFSARVSHLIRQALATGDCSIERVSGYLGMNKRTLQRKLKEDGVGYKDLLDDVRFDIACNYLLDCQGPLTTLSHMLCYSELSAFSNAFRRRFGVSPRAWKRQQQSRETRQETG